jgi:hypothetical protein
MPSAEIHLVAHADWSVSPTKRWSACALGDPISSWRLLSLSRVEDAGAYLSGLKKSYSEHGCILAGFDFPIGLPLEYAHKAGIAEFTGALRQFGHGAWQDFYQPAATPAQISLRRPFYPQKPGGKQLKDLAVGLGIQQLRRRCELAHEGRRAAAPLFWTMGAQQVGKAALAGWREVLVPGLQQPGLDLVLWPFSGTLKQLCAPGRVIVAETYPSEFYHHLGIEFLPGKMGKRRPADRAQQAHALFSQAQRLHLELDSESSRLISNGFDAGPDGEDRFDAFIGLLGMLDVLANPEQLWEPDDPELTRIEGWIFGQGRLPVQNPSR